ncbi:Transcriptional regulatory protein [Arthrobotrys conoides]|uniref:Transcriptional regulatory protein n=1 Tax=Arthrobotrys conoides TaxID=74498 RepID=A0AAN8RRF6_9PEZI
MRTSGRRGSKRFKTASVLKDGEESAPPPTTTTRTTSTPKFSPTPAASEPEPDREPQNVGNKSIQNDTTPIPEPKSTKSNSRKQNSKVPEVEAQPIDVLPPTTTTTTTTTAAAASTKQPNGSEKGSTEEDEEDSKSSPLTETSSASEQMASVAVFAPSADIKGTRTFEDLEMGNTESDRPSPDRSSAPPSISQPYMNGQSPESSSLSELDSDDSEAETERLNISPQKPILGNSTNSASYSTPKKSIGTSTLTSPSRSPSPLSTAGQESPKSPDREMTLGAIEQLTPEGSIAGSPVISPRKRKRNEGLDEEEAEGAGAEEIKDIMEISDLEDPPKKKVNVDSKPQDADGEEEADEEDSKDMHPKNLTLPPTNGHVSDAEDDSGAEDEDESPKPAQRSPGKNKQKLASAILSPKKLSAKVLDIDLDEDADEGRDTDAADSNHHNKDDDEADEMSRTKRQAADDLANIEILFAQLRDKLVEERVIEIDKEISMLYDGTHPELILMSQSIEAHKREKIEKANILLAFQEQTAEVERIANRAAIWAQYNQEIRETREKCFSEANTQWWAIHRERRAADTSLSDYVYRIPKALSTQINHRSRYNAEVSLLSGIAKHVGFPAAPSIAGASPDEVRSDLEAMGVRRRILSY